MERAYKGREFDLGRIIGLKAASEALLPRKEVYGMPNEPKRIRLADNTDLLGLVERVRSNKEPYVLERDGEVVAAIVSPEDLEKILLPEPSRAGIARALKAAGAWKDIDTDALVEKIYRARHESPPSSPVSI